MNAYTENRDKKFNLRINVMKTTYVGLPRTLANITYKNITFKKKIQDKESHIFFQNKISSRSPINAASKSEVWVFLESKLLVGLHLKNFFIDVSIIFHNIFKKHSCDRTENSEMSWQTSMSQFRVIFPKAFHALFSMASCC